MIDTIKFAIPITRHQYEIIKQKSVETLKFNHQTGEIMMRFWKSEVHLGSYDRKFNFFITEVYKPEIYIEFSIPKYLYGHNVYLFYPSELYECMENLYIELCVMFGQFPHFDTWRIQRLDLCYAWKYRTEDEAEEIMSLLKTFNYPRKKVSIYGTGVFFKGSSYSVKWYLKNPEYYVNDFPSVLKGNKDLAYHIGLISVGVLRFEVSLKRGALTHHFEKKNIYLKDLTTDIIKEKLTYFFDKAMEYGNGQTLNNKQVYKKLLETYGRTKAGNLFTFYVACNTQSKFNKNIIYATYGDSTIRRKKQLLKHAGISLMVNATNPVFDLSIPSPYATSPDPEALGGFSPPDDY